MEKATDVIPSFSEVTIRLAALPTWAHEKAMEIVYPDCPPPGVLYIMPALRKVFLVLSIGEALVAASNRAPTEVAS